MMNSFKLAYKFLKNNFKLYGLYLAVLIVTVATYYNFMALRYNDKFVQISERLQAATIASGACGFVLLWTVIFFMWYANNFFFKERQKEIGMYMLMGISSSKLGKVFALESIFLGGLSLSIGLPLGIIFSKLFFMIIGKAIMLNVQFPLTVSPRAILKLVRMFVIIFAFLAYKNYKTVKKSQLIDLINAAKKKSSVPKLNYIKGISGVLLIIAGYIIAIIVRQQELELFLAAMSTLIMVCTGTYLLFGSFLTIVFSKLINIKKFIYKNVRMVSVSNIFFRLKDNYRTLAMTAILAASTVTALSVSLSFAQYADDNVLIEAPYSFSYISSDLQLKDRVISEIEESKHELIGINTIKFCLDSVRYLDEDRAVNYNKKAIVTSYPQIKKTLEFLYHKKSDKLLKQLKPTEDEVSFILNANTITSPDYVVGENIIINGQNYSIKEDKRIPFTGNIPEWGKRNIYVLTESEYRKLRSNLSETTLNGVQVTNEKDMDRLISNITQFLPGESKQVFPRVTEYVWEHYALGIFYILGLIISLVFVLATFSTLYFKILSNALMDREKYSILKKIGMTKKEVIKSVHLQVGLEFILPVIVGIIHSIVAMRMVEELLNVTFTLQMLYGIGLFIVVIILFYIGISKNYVKMVYAD